MVVKDSEKSSRNYSEPLLIIRSQTGTGTEFREVTNEASLVTLLKWESRAGSLFVIAELA